MNVYFSLLIFVNLFTFSLSSNILFFHLICTSSHRTAIWPLAEELANSGHNVTYIYPIPGLRTNSHPQIEEVTPSKVVPLVKEHILDFDINIRLNHSPAEWGLRLLSKVGQICEAFYDSPEIQEWLKTPNLHFDLILIDANLNECGYGLVHKFKAKHILFAMTMMSHLYDGHGIVPESSSIPEFRFNKKPSEMAFFLPRMTSAVATLFTRYRYTKTFPKVHSVIQRTMNFTKFPQIKEFEKNTSLILLNSHFVEDYPLSLPPMVQSYSGLWCSEKYLGKGRNKLTEKLERFIQSGRDGFIYVSFGTIVKTSTMPESMRKGFFEALGAFPKMRFLMKWDGPMPEGVPKNVLLQNWFPQRDILAHPKIKGFINQAGRPSTQEALCYAVPVINIPVLGDQVYNANRLEYLGLSIIVNIDNFRGADLKNAIGEILENPKYNRRTTQMSKVFRDRPLDPLENAKFWTEYVLRHEDLSILKPLGRNQTWFQRRLIDVYLILMGAVLLILTINFLLLSWSVKFIIRRCTIRSNFKEKSA